MDKQSAIGFGLLLLLLAGYLYINKDNPSAESEKDQTKAPKTEQVAKDSTAQTQKDSTQIVENSPAPEVEQVAEETILLSNDVMDISFTNIGAYPTKIYLKKYKTFSQKELNLFDGPKNYYDFEYKVGGAVKHTKGQSFSHAQNGNSITFTNDDGIALTYTLPEGEYMMDVNLKAGQSDRSGMKLNWESQSLHIEKDKANETRYASLCYNIADDGFERVDNFTEKETEELSKTVNFVSFKQHFFNTTVIPEKGVAESGVATVWPTDESEGKYVTNFKASLDLKSKDELNFKIFNGPNEYKTLKQYNEGIEEIVPLSIYSWLGFIKYINKWFIIPIFNFLAKYISNYGIVILILTFIIRLIMSPFTYKSYVSSAKMKALKPELDALKEKFKDNQQAYGMEQMKLYKQAGVNPLGGCLPALLQMPVFLALFSFFPHAIELRQKKFLWADDLSSYDSILTLPFDIPMYGSHVSLFTILFCVTSMLLALYSMSTATARQDNPVMKYLPFIMPIMFLGIFNSFPAALTFYYFVSNLITLGLQVVIQKFIINPDKIRAQILAKKNEPPKESKFVKKMQQLQEQNKEKMNRSQRRQ